MTFEYGIGMFFYGLGCIAIAAIIAYFIINKVHDEDNTDN